MIPLSFTPREVTSQCPLVISALKGQHGLPGTSWCEAGMGQRRLGCLLLSLSEKRLGCICTATPGSAQKGAWWRLLCAWGSSKPADLPRA